MKSIEPVDIIVPTFNNIDLLSQCVSSMLSMHLAYPIRILIVNNGHPASLDGLPPHSYVKIIQTGGRNLGWEGGLKEGLKHSTSQFVCFANDDIFIPNSSYNWLSSMMSVFSHPEVAAVGPSSNVVMGPQNIWKALPHNIIETTFLIGFCMVVRRKMLDEVGGIDDTLPGGDDLDLSIRLRSAGYKLIAKRDVFVFHHGFVTGTRLHGGGNVKGGWNSVEMTEKTDHALQLKHGFKKWFKCRAGLDYPGLRKGVDSEGDIVRKHIVGEAVVDLGCANNKTIPSAIGVDIIKRGESIPCINGVSDADVQADVEEELPFEKASKDVIIARHILEHTLDPISVVRMWATFLKPGGRLIIAVPDEDQSRSINMNPEHIHAFNQKSIRVLAGVCGLTELSSEKTTSCSFVSVFEKGDTK